MNIKAKVVNNDLICLIHNEEVKYVVQQKNHPFHDRFLCQKCFDNAPEGTKTITIYKIKKNPTFNRPKSSKSISPKTPKTSQDLNIKLTYQTFLDFMNFESQYSDYKQKLEKYDLIPKVKKIQVVQEVKQMEVSYAMAFNSSGTIMVSGCDAQIKIWQFDWQLNKSQTLSGHTDKVQCLIFSKRMNWFASGGRDGRVLSWLEDDTWKCYDSCKENSGAVNCLILNKEESQLISCHKIIMIWIVKNELNIIVHEYTLEQKHTEEILAISLNESETTLVSCSQDKQIIIWNKKDQKWSYQNHIVNDDFGQRICFIDHDIIVVQLGNKEISEIFIIDDGNLKRKDENNIQFKEKAIDFHLFPTIYNKQRKIILQKYGNYVYILQQLKDGKFIFSCDPVNCFTSFNFGTLSNDGQYLVLWNDHVNAYLVYKIEYT